MSSQKKLVEFKKGMDVVYPAHGVGRVADVETQVVAGFSLEMIAVEIARSRMVIRIPKAKIATSGLRPVMDKATAEKVLSLLEGKAKRSRSLWAKRAQDYEAKINSGDVMPLAEVVRDLSRAVDDPASYSEKTIYESALERLTAELALALDVTETEAAARVARHLALRPARGGSAADADEEAEDAAAA